MSTRYTCRIADPFGTPLAEVANFADPVGGGGAALEYALNVGQIGLLQLTVPATFNADLFRLDGRIGVWRAINGRPPKLDGQAIFLIRKWRYTDQDTTIWAVHANELLRRRIVAYAAGSSYSSKIAATAAGNLIKAFARENLGSSISGANRDGADTQTDISAYLTTQIDLGDGASLATQDARRNLFDVVRELQDASTTAGTYLAAEIVAPTESTLELRTYATQRGVDHRAGTVQPVILSPQRGSLANCALTVDRMDEVTVAICGGTGEGVQRLIATSIDTTRMGESPLNRRELFGDYSNISDAAALQDKADALVRAGRPRIEFVGDLQETDGATRGIHYDLGDQVTAEFRQQQYDVRLDVIGVRVGGGAARTQAQLRSVT